MAFNKKKWEELQLKTGGFPFKAITEVENKIDPVDVDRRMGLSFIRMPDGEGNNIWHFEFQRERNEFVAAFEGVKVYEDRP